jgi:hypothetical protein
VLLPWHVAMAFRDFSSTSISSTSTSAAFCTRVSRSTTSRNPSRGSGRRLAFGCFPGRSFFPAPW